MTGARAQPTGLTDAIHELSLLHPFRRFEALRLACDDAIAIWRRYCAAEKPIEYMDSIVGMHHTVDETLPMRALDDIDRYLTGTPITSTVAQDYVEPTVAMQDNDLDFPDDIENIYYAIYNLHGLCAGSLTVDEAVIIQQVANSTQVSADDWARDWWTRCWDAWATRPDPVYDPAPVHAFDALAAGDLTSALEPDPTVADGLLHAILLALQGQVTGALDAIALVTGADLRDPALARWLTQHLYDLVPEAIAVTPDRQRYAAFSGNRLVFRDVTGAAIDDATMTRGRIVRLARYTSDTHLHVAGDQSDDIGVVGSWWGLYSDSRSTTAWTERRGRRTLVATAGMLVPMDAAEAMLCSGSTTEVLGPVPVVAAALSPDLHRVATHDGQRVTIWDRERTDSRVLPSPSRPRRLAIAGGKLFVTWANHTASLHELA